MKKYLKGTRLVNTQEYQNINLEYYLIESTYMETGLSKTAYGIEILKTTGELIETDIIQKITDSKQKAMEIINKLIANTVTPIGMVYAIDELI